MKPAQQVLVMGLAGLCGTAYSAPQVPYYTSKFANHPQNLGMPGDYPKYWQGEAYRAPGQGQAEPTYYNNPTPPPSPIVPEPRPDFTQTKYPAKSAIKFYGGESFPVKPVSKETTGGSGGANEASESVKITNDTPFGPIDNDRSYTRVTKSPSLQPAPVPEPVQVDAVSDSGTDSSSSGSNDDQWSSFTFGVVSDTITYHDPYEGREGDFARKTNAMQKIERMMGKGYPAKDRAAAGSGEVAPSRVRRGLYKRTYEPIPSSIEESSSPELLSGQETQHAVSESGKQVEDDVLIEIDLDPNEDPDALFFPPYFEPAYDLAFLRNYGYDRRLYSIPTLRRIDAFERAAVVAGVFDPGPDNPFTPRLRILVDGGDDDDCGCEEDEEDFYDGDECDECDFDDFGDRGFGDSGFGNRGFGDRGFDRGDDFFDRGFGFDGDDGFFDGPDFGPFLAKRDWPEHIQEKASKMMNNAKEMQEKGQLVIDNDPKYQDSLKEKELQKEKEIATQAPPADGDLAPPQTNKAVPAAGKKASVGGTGSSGDLSPPPQANQPAGGMKAKQPMQPMQPNSQGQPRQPGHKQPTQPNGQQPRPQRQAQPQQPKKQPQQGNFPQQGFPQKYGKAGKGFKKAPKLQRRDTIIPAGPEYPPGTTIIRRPKVATDFTAPAPAYAVPQPAHAAPQPVYAAPQPVYAAPQPVYAAPQPISIVNQINDGQNQIQPKVPVAIPPPVAAPRVPFPGLYPAKQIPDGQVQIHPPPPVSQIPDGQVQIRPQIAPVPAPAPAPAPPVRIPVPPTPATPIYATQTVRPPPVREVVRPVVTPQLEVTYVPRVRPGEVLCPEERITQVPVVTEAIKATPRLQPVQVEREVKVTKEVPIAKEVKVVKQPVAAPALPPCPCGTPVCGECLAEPASFSSSYSNGVETTSCSGPGPCPGVGPAPGPIAGPIVGPGNKAPLSNPAALEAFWRKQVPHAFNS